MLTGMIVVSGASGNVGVELVRVLGAAGQAVRPLRHADGEDLNDPASLRSALDGADGLFLLPGYADMPGLYAQAAAAGVRRVVQLSGASAASGDRSNAVTAYMIRSEEAARSSAVEWTILRPSAFAANALRWLPQLRDGDEVRLQYPEVAAAVIDPLDIARVAAAALTGDGHAGRIYRLTGPQALRPAEQLAILGAALGRELVAVPLSNAQTRAEQRASMPEEYAEAFWNFYAEGALDESVVTDAVEQATGTPPRSFAAWCEAHAAEFAA
ncbi:NAD(P)H-binding protein [Dactylosporangium matsuzakiense]|uniref:Nucleotide-diphosphate-sugar epimerase n=2 Tax=Dactylosporangium matsuzakiense TaxID=53360 RepID=A0A9W6NS01_9ACTN|nr:nucleotide-diphosphate-sugar epimerase [Dactylosporangium matsuzakiense]